MKALCRREIDRIAKLGKRPDDKLTGSDMNDLMAIKRHQDQCIKCAFLVKDGRVVRENNGIPNLGEADKPNTPILCLLYRHGQEPGYFADCVVYTDYVVEEADNLRLLDAGISTYHTFLPSERTPAQIKRHAKLCGLAYEGIELTKLPMREDNGFKPCDLKDLAIAQLEYSKSPEQAIGCVITLNNDCLIIAANCSIKETLDDLNDKHPGLLPGSPGYINRDGLKMYCSSEPDATHRVKIEGNGIKFIDWRPEESPAQRNARIEAEQVAPKPPSYYGGRKLHETRSRSSGLSQKDIDALNDLPDETNNHHTHLAEFQRKIDKPEFEAVTIQEITAYCIETASLSFCRKRKVGAVIMHDEVCLEFVSSGCNQPGDGGSEAKDQVLHAEVQAIEHMNQILGDSLVKPKGTSSQWMRERMIMYITHEPCAGCIAAMRAAGIHKWVVVEDFMKFDAGKPRFDLIPPIVYTALAAIFTYGAKKYSPNNWRQCDDLGQYTAAVMRHWVAYIDGERLDADSGKPHLWHVLTNVAFLIWFDDQESKQNEK